MSNNPLPYRHIQEQTERQLLNIMVDKLCCISENTTANNEYKIAYYQEISSSTGTITIPTGATILLNQLAGGADALVSTIDGVPTGSLPQTSGGVQVDVTSFDSSGNYVLSGTPSSYPVALIYWLKISAADYPNLDINNIIEENIPLLVDNIYTADGTLTGDRTITGGGNDITFSGGSLGSSDMTWNGRDLYINNSNGFYAVASVILHGSRGLYKGNNTYGQFNFLGASGGAPYINRDIADANPSLIVDNRNAASTGDIAQFQNSTGTVASITNEGYITAQAATGTSDTVAIWDGTTLKKKELIIESGTYTPTFSDFVEVTSITNQNARYNRVGNIVTVYCDMLFEATTANVLQTFKMTLPISSNLTSSNDLTGTMTYALGTGTPPAHGIITGDSTNDKADVTIRVSRTDNRRSYIIFTYEIK